MQSYKKAYKKLSCTWKAIQGLQYTATSIMLCTDQPNSSLWITADISTFRRQWKANFILHHFFKWLSQNI